LKVVGGGRANSNRLCLQLTCKEKDALSFRKISTTTRWLGLGSVTKWIQPKRKIWASLSMFA